MRTESLPELAGRSLLIFALRTLVSEEVISEFERILAPAEYDRAAQFRVARARDSYVVTRGALRLLLGRYLGAGARTITLRYGPHGKPAIDSDTGLRFNVTHSGRTAAIALTAGCEIGIDVEELRPLPDLKQIATRFLCAEDAAEILARPADRREHAFFACWTRKEAWLKATGAGLSMPLTSFRVVENPDGSGNFTIAEADTAIAKSWTLQDLRLSPDSVSAIAYNDSPRPITLSTIDDPLDLLRISAGN